MFLSGALVMWEGLFLIFHSGIALLHPLRPPPNGMTDFTLQNACVAVNFVRKLDLGSGTPTWLAKRGFWVCL